MLDTSIFLCANCKNVPSSTIFFGEMTSVTFQKYENKQELKVASGKLANVSAKYHSKFGQ